MKRTLIILLIATMLAMAGATALAYDETAFGAENTPGEIVDYIASSRWSGWRITGWVNPGTLRQDAAQAFVAVKSGRQNDLLAFRRDGGGRFAYAWHNAAALPQGDSPIELAMWGDGGGTPGFHSYYVVGGELQEASCFWAQDERGTWNLSHVAVFGLPAVMFIDATREGVLHMTNEGWVDGPVTDTNIYGRYQRDLRYFSFAAFPTTVAEAREKLSNPPDIPGGTLSAKEIRFTSGKKYRVYQGPGEAYGQAANGKASVSTNDWIQVFGEENGWIMIQYDISSDRMRIGWIEASALPRDAQVDALSYAPVSAYMRRDAPVTDDPLKSQTAIAHLAEGCWVTWLATMGDWAYVESGTGDLIRGFVPADALSTERVFQLEDYPLQNGGGNRMRGSLTLTRGGVLRVEIQPQALARPAAYYTVLEEIGGGKVLDALPRAGVFTGEGRTDATACLICPVYADGKVDRENAVSVQW